MPLGSRRTLRVRRILQVRRKEPLLSITKALGRAALAAMFVHGGFAAAKEPGKRVKLLEGAGISHPELAARVNGAAMTIAGGTLALGIAPRVAAAVLAGSLVPTTLVGHSFWNEEGEARAAQKIRFMKYLAMLGGLLLIMAEEE